MEKNPNKSKASPFNLARPVPILLLGDGPPSSVATTGLGRLAADTARLLSGMPQFRVGLLGRNALGSSQHPWTQYSFPANQQWGEAVIGHVWNDFSQGDYGIIMTLWDASRLTWFANSVGMPPEFQQWMANRSFQKWSYFMQDSAGIGNGLPLEVRLVLDGFDRVLMASKWAKDLSPAHADLDWMPHMIDTEVFQPRDPLPIASAWNIKPTDKLVGCVMSNQERKYWPNIFEALALLPANVRLWAKTDRLLAYWNLEALAIEYGVSDRVFFETQPLSDQAMSWRYSACDATVLISGGEGFGYPIAESLACGVPCVTGTYGAGYELIPAWCSVAPYGHTIKTSHAVKWALYDSRTIATKLKAVINVSPRGVASDSVAYRERVEHLGIDNLNIPWRKWLLKGIGL